MKRYGTFRFVGFQRFTINVSCGLMRGFRTSNALKLWLAYIILTFAFWNVTFQKMTSTLHTTSVSFWGSCSTSGTLVSVRIWAFPGRIFRNEGLFCLMSTTATETQPYMPCTTVLVLFLLLYHQYAAHRYFAALEGNHTLLLFAMMDPTCNMIRT